MPAPLRTPCDSWIEAGLKVLCEGGPNAVRVESLAQTLGVTKGGFYGQFSDRTALLEAMLDTWERMSTDDVIYRVEAEEWDARVKVRRAGALTFSTKLLPIDLAVRDWARHDPAVPARLRSVDDRRMDYLRRLFASFAPDPAGVEARSLLAFTLAIGQHFVAAEHDEHTRKEVLELAVSRLLA